MASLLYVTEFSASGIHRGTGVNLAMQTPVAEQVVNYGAGAATSAAFNKNTRMVRIHTDSICSILFSTAGTSAGTSNARLAANQTEYFQVPDIVGQLKVSAITNT